MSRRCLEALAGALLFATRYSPRDKKMAEATVAKKTYYKVAAALMVLLVLTVAAGGLPFSGPWHVGVALAIAFAKAALIVLFFMHVKYSSRLTMVFAGAGLLWLVILFLLTFSDYVSRAWVG